MPISVASTSLRVRYAETDAQGVVYHANHLVYFEVARGAFMREAGVDYNALEASGHFIVVAEANVRYLGAARYDDELTVTARVKELRNRSMTFEYELHRGATLLATGWTAHVCLGRDGKPVRWPETLLEHIAEAPAGDAG